MFVGAIMNNDKNTINILKTSIAVFSLLSIFNFIGIANSSYGLHNKTADSKNFFILKTTTKKYCKSESCDFDYTGDEQMFVAPKTGTYKLETWGAQGGSITQSLISNYGYLKDNYSEDLPGGYGGYSTGTSKLNYNSKIYINVGGAGTSSATGQVDSTYNGGGTGGGGICGDRRIGSSGGGSTHIATKSGLLSTLENYKSSILSVSGGGGGAYAQLYHPSGAQTYGPGGNAGGYLGTSPNIIYAISFCGSAPSGGTQSVGGTNYSFYQCGLFDSEEDNSKFGSGSYAKSDGACISGSGGGGGYFGGGAGGYTGGGGGSGYISNTSLTDKHMACYNCETSNEESTKTISVTCASETPTTDCAKIGNGYARITYLGN